MPLQKEHGYTIHDIYALPEGKGTGVFIWHAGEFHAVFFQ